MIPYIRSWLSCRYQVTIGNSESMHSARSSYAGRQTQHRPSHPPTYAPSAYYNGSGPPPGVDPQLWQWFSAVDSDRSGAISVTELQTALVNGTLDRSLVSSNGKYMWTCRKLDK
jgi:hypothetical protein